MKVAELSVRDKAIYYALKATGGAKTTGIAKLLSVSTRDVTEVKRQFFEVRDYTKSERTVSR